MEYLFHVKHKILIAFLLLIVLIIGLYAMIDGLHYTYGELLLHYWKHYLVAYVFGGLALWLMIKSK